MNHRQLDTACTMLLQGKSVAAVASKLRLSSSDVYKLLADAGKPVRELRAARRKAIALDLDRGDTIPVVMAKYGCTRGYVYGVRKEMEASQQ